MPAHILRRLVLKELADNALDAGARVAVGRGRLNRDGVLVEGSDWFFVQDDGAGLDPDDVAQLFSFNRPLVSSKLRRLPTRGAMGNGLRVVAAAVAASCGSLRVWTRNRLLILRPRKTDGTTAARSFPVDFPTATRIEIRFGDKIPYDTGALDWARMAVRMAEGEIYKGKTSPWWYDADSFYELCQASGSRLVRDLIETLDGCSGAKAGKIAAGFLNTPCNALTEAQTTALLIAARAEARPVSHKRLGKAGSAARSGMYASCVGDLRHGAHEPMAELPFVVEAWASPLHGHNDKAAVQVLVNRTPIPGELAAYRDKRELWLNGCGLHYLTMDAPRGSFSVVVNITTPYCPITTTGKQPDLSRFKDEIAGAVTSAIKRAKNAQPRTSESATLTHKAIILMNLDEAVAKVSGGERYRYNQRQLFYVLRPIAIEMLGQELTWGNFVQIITDYESENGEIPGMYRDPRGTLYHPHDRQDIALGTLAVEAYERPAWTFNKVLYIEKEGFFEPLKAARWPERHDCALLTSKGYASRAVRDLLDGMAEDAEPVTVFCVHDADAHGTMIYQTLQEATKARGRRLVEVVNLGLEPWEALEMGLEEEAVERSDRNKPVADYVLAHPHDRAWRAWLSEKRVELNAMTMPEFIEWLDRKMAKHNGQKVVPPSAVVAEEMETRLDDHLRSAIRDRILREARIEEQVKNARAGLSVPNAEIIVEKIEEWLPENEATSWRAYVDEAARDLTRDEE